MFVSTHDLIEFIVSLSDDPIPLPVFLIKYLLEFSINLELLKPILIIYNLHLCPQVNGMCTHILYFIFYFHQLHLQPLYLSLTLLSFDHLISSDSLLQSVLLLE